ncbi:hypothetical protein [Runella sp.]|uniref:hypothetical protein n=1 Tax=Runella sp. TaxID=1960881 RepID=UPI003D125A06
MKANDIVPLKVGTLWRFETKVKAEGLMLPDDLKERLSADKRTHEIVVWGATQEECTKNVKRLYYILTKNVKSKN